LQHHFLTQLLLSLNLEQQEFFPALSAMQVAGTQFCRQTIDVSLELKQ
jgi:hypothetical protein